MEETPVADAVVVDRPVAEKPKTSPAQDLRDIQALIVNGIFPGNIAPQVVKAYQLLEQMALLVEKAAAEDAK